jgi:dihydrodipicolinate synthase/N-acetylneuraminate lyase
MKHGPRGIKAAMDRLGFFGGDPQSPLKRPSAQGLVEIQQALAAVKEVA